MKIFGKESKSSAPVGQSTFASPAGTPFIQSNSRKRLPTSKENSQEFHTRLVCSPRGSRDSALQAVVACCVVPSLEVFRATCSLILSGRFSAPPVFAELRAIKYSWVYQRLCTARDVWYVVWVVAFVRVPPHS